MGRLDVDAMLVELTPKEFNQWWASAILEGWADGWTQPGTIAAEAHNAGLRAVAAQGGGRITTSDLRDARSYGYQGERWLKPPTLSAKASEAKAAALYGQ